MNERARPLFLLVSTISALLLSGVGCGQTEPPKPIVRGYDSYTHEELMPKFIIPDVAPKNEPPKAEPPKTEPQKVEPVASPVPQGTSVPNEAKSEEVNITQFQVLVFPHLGKYAIPQGRELVTNTVTIQAGTNCTSYSAVKNADHEWVKVGSAMNTESKFVLTMKDESLKAGPVYFECANGFTVKRGKNYDEFTYTGHFVAQLNKKSVHIINLVEPETYLKGVVPSEVLASWPMTVLKVQAIAARTYAWWTVQHARRAKDKEADMDDTVMYQAYTGSSKTTDNTDKAVDETNNILIRTEQGEVIEAFFSADSGGYTESSLDAFRIALPYCQAKKELYNVNKYNTNWSKVVTLSEIAADLIAAKLIPEETVLQHIEATKIDVSGRVKTLTVTTNTGKKIVINGGSFTDVENLRSRLFQFVITNDSVTINGKGYGHGVGMSQIGALQYVQQLHWTFDQILKFYYTGTTLTQ